MLNNSFMPSVEDMCKDTFLHFRDGMDVECRSLFQKLNPKGSEAHRIDMAILYSNDFIENEEYLLAYDLSSLTNITNDKKLIVSAINTSYNKIYSAMVTAFDELKNHNAERFKSEVAANDARDSILHGIIVLKNFANLKIKIDSILEAGLSNET